MLRPGRRHAPSAWTRHARVACLALAAATGIACSGERVPVVFPSGPSGALALAYPFDESLFPPEIAAPTFVWEDETDGVASWEVLLRFDAAGEPQRFPTTETTWRPVRGGLERDQAAQRRARRRVRGRGPRRSRRGGLVEHGPHPHLHRPGRRLHLLSRGAAALHRRGAGPLAHPLALRVRSTPRRAAADRSRGPSGLRQLPLLLGQRRDVLGLDVDYGNDKGGYAILPVSKEMVLDDEKIITWSDYRRDDGEAHLRAPVAGLARRPLCDQHGQGPRGLRRDAGDRVLAALLPDQGHPRRLRHGRNGHLHAAARRRRSGVRPEQPHLEPGRAVDRLRPREGSTARRRSPKAPRASCSTRTTSPSSSRTTSPSSSISTACPSTRAAAAGRADRRRLAQRARATSSRSSRPTGSGSSSARPRTTCCSCRTASSSSCRPRAARRGVCARTRRS